MAVTTLTEERKDTIEKILALAIVELSNGACPYEGEDGALQWVKDTGHDAKLFFGSNGQGLQEYEAFVAKFDKDAYEQRQERERRAKLMQAHIKLKEGVNNGSI